MDDNISSNSLTKSTRELIGTVLSEAKGKFNGDKECVKGVQRAFKETVMPGHRRHSELRELLDRHKAVKPKRKSKEHDPKRHYCRYGCGESWADKNAKGLKQHHKKANIVDTIMMTMSPSIVDMCS
jgi:hypothetical protein